MNELLIKKTAFYGPVTLGNAATTWTSSVFIPAGAIITGARVMAPGAVTTTDASATICLYVSSTPIVSTTKINAVVGAQTIPVNMTLIQAGGVYVPATAALAVYVSASSSSACTAVVNFYVDYLYV
jgi:hypothetical protein